MNIRDIVDNLARQAYEQGEGLEASDREGLLNGIVDNWINTASFIEHAEILDELGEIDLSDPRPDLRAGWRALRAQCAYNALAHAVRRALKEIAEGDGGDQPEAP